MLGISSELVKYETCSERGIFCFTLFNFGSKGLFGCHL